MNVTTHGYLPHETENGVGFTRVALADMSRAQLAYITETRGMSTLVNSDILKDKKWQEAYSKLKASTVK